MKKKILTILLSCALLFTSAGVFSGCGILHQNNKRYYADAVAIVGEEEVTRNEVLTMFNYYYYTAGYYQYGYTEEQVYKMVLEALIKTKILVQEAKKLPECQIDDADRAYIWEQVFSNVSSQIDSHESEIKKIYGVEEEEKEQTTSAVTPFSEYERKTSTTELAQATEVKTKEQWLESIRSEANEQTNKYRYLAYRKYVNELVRNAEKYDNKVGTNEEVLDNELNRLYTYYEESRLVSKYTAYISSKLSITDAEVMDKYNEIIKKQIQQYSVTGAYDSAITSTSNTDLVIYRDNCSEKSYFTVQHILLKFADYDDSIEISSSIKGASQELSEHRYFVYQKGQGSLEQEYEEEYLQDREEFANRDGSLDLTYINPTTGETDKDDDGNEKKFTTIEDFEKLLFGAEGVYTKYESSEITASELAEEFLKLKYSFSKDSNVTDLTNLTNLVGYTFSCDEEDDNGYIAEFSETAYDLYDEYVASNGTKYGIKKVVTNFGVHYIMFTGVASDTTLTLDDKFTMVRNETVYDYIYDSLLTDKMSNLTNSTTSLLYNEYKNANKIVVKFEHYEDCL